MSPAIKLDQRSLGLAGPTLIGGTANGISPGFRELMTGTEGFTISLEAGTAGVAGAVGTEGAGKLEGGFGFGTRTAVLLVCSRSSI